MCVTLLNMLQISQASRRFADGQYFESGYVNTFWILWGQETCCVQALSYHDKVFWVYNNLVKSHYTFLSRVGGNAGLCFFSTKIPRASGKASTSFRKAKANYQVNFKFPMLLLETQAFAQSCTCWNQFSTRRLELMLLTLEPMYRILQHGCTV